MADRSWSDASEQAGSQDYFDTLMGALIECTTLIESFDKLVQHYQHPESLSLAQELLYRCFTVEEKLLRWYENEFKSSPEFYGPWEHPYIASILTTVPMSTTFMGALGAHFDFSSFRVAHAHLLYWTGLVLLYPIIGQTLSVFGKGNLVKIDETNHDQSQSQPQPQPQQQKQKQKNEYMAQKCQTCNTNDFILLADHYATNICRSAAYCVQSKFKAIGPQTILSPLWAVQQFFWSHSSITENSPWDKILWCATAFEIVTSNIGLGFAARIAKLSWSEYPRDLKIKSLCQ